MAVKKLEHVGIMVRDIEASAAWYRDVIGMEIVGMLAHNNEVIKLAFLSFPGYPESQVELIEGYNADLPDEGKVHHIAFTVDDIDQEWNRLKDLEVKFIDSEITLLSNGARYFFFYGPDGERIEMFQPGSPA
ncbi:glyoxalase [Paenibacillus swuensis]|uniref:Glyoxalase n=1 Tax=Paenibacillus swuensis TaxID=1178515 RepID=A0A172TH68_9BACL|nr:VOC family protein [Paenibacillus swuensis]ANE46312.1 glyoxalase [Paenibacillus swuensis]